MQDPFRYFSSSTEAIRLAVTTYIRYPPSPGQVENLLFECGIDVRHATIRFWWNRPGPIFAAKIRQRRQCYSHWRWHLDGVFARINGETHYLWRAVVHKGGVPEVSATKRKLQAALSGATMSAQ